MSRSNSSPAFRNPVCRVLIPLATPSLYGLERAVIETFDALRPEVTPIIVQSKAVHSRRPPIIDELERRTLAFSLLPDGKGWPTLGYPRSPRCLVRMLFALLKANVYYARAMGRADALYVTGSRAALFMLASAVRCRLSGKRVIHHFHELPTRRLPTWKRLVTDFVHNTAHGRDVAFRVDPAIRSARNAVLPCVVDTLSASMEAPLPREGAVNVLFAGQVALHKGIDLLVGAFGRIAGRHPDARLHIVGGCEESFLPSFRRMCERSQAAAQIRYWGYRTDAMAFLRDAYVCVQPTPPSRCAESFGRTVVEAMGFGVPSVCLGSGALTEIVVHGETGLVCHEDEGALAGGLERFLDDVSFRDYCGGNALRRYHERYGRDVARTQWLKFLGWTADAASLAEPGAAPLPG